MTKKRGNNEGSIYKRKDGRYVGQVQIGHDAEGKPIRKYFYGIDRKEVGKKMTTALNQVQEGTIIKSNRVTLSEWLDKWMDLYQEDLSVNFKFRRKELIKLHIKPALGKVQLTKLKPADILAFYKKLSASGRIDGKGGLAPGTIKQIHNILNPALARAVDNGLIPINIMTSVKPPKNVKTRESRPLTKEEAKLYLQTLSEHRMYAAFRVELATGLRRGELLGLKWSDLNTETGIIKVKRQVIRVQHGERSTLEYATLKTASSEREIKLSLLTRAVLDGHKVQQAEEKRLAGNGYNDEDLIFCTPTGEKLDTKHLYNIHCKALAQAGIAHTAFHSLRHTVATLLLEQGESIPAVQALMGHSNPKTLLGIYAHPTSAMAESTADKLDSLLKEAPPMFFLNEVSSQTPGFIM